MWAAWRLPALALLAVVLVVVAAQQGPQLAVLVQQLVPSDCAAVAFSGNPVTGARDEVVIEANWGLGESIVSGLAAADPKATLKLWDGVNHLLKTAPADRAVPPVEAIEVWRGFLRELGQAGIPIVAIVGYTNAGKSTLFNAMVKARTYAADQLFATLDTTTKSISASTSLLVALWFRYSFQAVVTTALVWKGRDPRLFHTRHPRFQLSRGLLLFGQGARLLALGFSLPSCQGGAFSFRCD